MVVKQREVVDEQGADDDDGGGEGDADTDALGDDRVVLFSWWPAHDVVVDRVDSE